MRLLIGKSDKSIVLAQLYELKGNDSLALVHLAISEQIKHQIKPLISSKTAALIIVELSSNQEFTKQTSNSNLFQLMLILTLLAIAIMVTGLLKTKKKIVFNAD